MKKDSLVNTGVAVFVFIIIIGIAVFSTVKAIAAPAHTELNWAWWLAASGWITTIYMSYQYGKATSKDRQRITVTIIRERQGAIYRCIKGHRSADCFLVNGTRMCMTPGCDAEAEPEIP